MPHNHAHPGHDPDWNAEAGRYNDLMDALEPELSKATVLLLQAADVGPEKRVLDLACGPGHTTAAATATGAKVLGIDSSPEMIRHAQQRFPESQFQIGDMLAPPQGPWDAIVCRLGGHHADAKWIAAAVNVLAAGGRLAIAETDAIDATARSNGMKTPGEWMRLMQDAGLENVEAMQSDANFDNIAAWKADENRPRGVIYVIIGRKASMAGEWSR